MVRVVCCSPAHVGAGVEVVDVGVCVWYVGGYVLETVTV